MKNLLFAATALACASALVSCSVTRKYSYNFDYHTYHRSAPDLVENSAEEGAVNELKINQEPLKMGADELMASTRIMITEPKDMVAGIGKKYGVVDKSYLESGRTISRKELKSGLKELRKKMRAPARQDEAVSADPAYKDFSGIDWLALVLSLAGSIVSILGMWPLGLLLIGIALVLLLVGNKNRETKPVSSTDTGTETNTPAARKNGLAIAGFILSLAGLFLWPLTIPGIIFSALGMKSEKRGLAIAGLVIGIVGLVVWAILNFMPVE